ncbi:DUF192 domain-containing protein [Phaeospirillum tilakii]|uniref:DUF192 domain-containing protein n=1 Tax=Phaeospirillum tilakii TaxID=741673 RepID=A0ABW5C832_9PROT
MAQRGWIRAVGLALLVALGLAGPAEAAPAAAEPATVRFERAPVALLTADGRRVVINAELATSPAQLEQGLMFRTALAADGGMLFDFGAPRMVAMWMKNTLIPLDMLFIDATGTIRYIEENAPPHSLEPRGPALPVRAVMELAGGSARRLGLRPGDRVEHPIFAAAPMSFR